MADAIFTIRVKEFHEYKTGIDCPYEIKPAPSSKGIQTGVNKQKNGRQHPWYKFTSGVSLHVGHYQKQYTYAAEPRIPTTVRFDNPKAILQFDVVDANGQKGSYHPIGIAFLRADGTPPVAAPHTTSAQKIPLTIAGKAEDSPFSKLKLNDPEGRIEVDVERIAKLYSKDAAKIKEKFAKDKNSTNEGSHRTYRVVVFIQKLETGEIGVIDPEIEPPT